MRKRRLFNSWGGTTTWQYGIATSSQHSSIVLWRYVEWGYGSIGIEVGVWQYGSMEWSLTVWEYGMGEWWHGGMNWMFDGMEFGSMGVWNIECLMEWSLTMLNGIWNFEVWEYEEFLFLWHCLWNERMTESNYLCTRNARLCVWNLRRQSNSTDWQRERTGVSKLWPLTSDDRSRCYWRSVIRREGAWFHRHMTGHMTSAATISPVHLRSYLHILSPSSETLLHSDARCIVVGSIMYVCVHTYVFIDVLCINLTI